MSRGELLPEPFAVTRGAGPSKHKQFRRAGARRGRPESAVHRTATELSAPISLESLPYQVARIVDPADAEFMDKQVSAKVLTRTDGVMLVLFSARWRLEGFQRDNPDVKLGSLVAAEG